MRVDEVAVLVEAEVARPGIVVLFFTLDGDLEESASADGQVGGFVGGFESALAEVAIDRPDAHTTPHLGRARGGVDVLADEILKVHAGAP